MAAHTHDGILILGELGWGRRWPGTPEARRFGGELSGTFRLGGRDGTRQAGSENQGTQWESGIRPTNCGEIRIKNVNREPAPATRMCDCQKMTSWRRCKESVRWVCSACERTSSLTSIYIGDNKMLLIMIIALLVGLIDAVRQSPSSQAQTSRRLGAVLWWTTLLLLWSA